METIDIIKDLCAKQNLSIAQLEGNLGYGNGSIAKSKNMSADRVYQIAQYFNVPMEYLMTGKTVEDTESEIALLRQQQAILMEINQINTKITTYYREIAECQNELTKLKTEYKKLETKKTAANTDDPTDWDALFDIDVPFK